MNLSPEIKQLKENVEAKRAEWLRAQEVLQGVCPHFTIDEYGTKDYAWVKHWDEYVSDLYHQCSICGKLR
jgi:hypothetical protein